MGARRRGSRALLFVAVAALALAVAAVVVIACQTDPREVRAMRTPGAIVGITYGSQPLVLGTWGQKCLLRAFPALQPRIGGAVLRPSSAPPASLVIWQNRGPLVRYEGPWPTLPVTLIAEDGEKLRVEPGSWDSRTVGDDHLLTFVLSTFPRRGRRIRIRFERSWPAINEPDRVATNPVPGIYPSWTPEAAPVQRRFGEFEITAERLYACKQREFGPGAEATLVLAAREGGHAAVGTLAAERVRVTDPTGNVWETTPVSMSDETGHISAPVADALLPGEAAYRVRVELARTGRYPREDLWTIPNLPIPPPGEVVRLSRTGRVHGCTLELTHLIGEHADSGLPWGSSEATAAVRISGPANRFCLRQPARSGRGLDEYTVFEAGGYYCVTLGHAGTRGPVNLTLALTPRHTVEFLAHATSDTGRAAHR